MVKVLPYKDEVAGEIRPAYFLKAFGREVLDMRIFSFGACNFNCPYCKRDGQYVAADGTIITSVACNEDLLLEKAEKAVKAGQVVRLSGGDPVMYPNFSLQILQRVKELGGVGSIAHNGSSPAFIEKLIPYLDFAAIDLKAATGKELALRAGLKSEVLGDKMLNNSLRVQELLSNADVLVDVRTCVFSTTTLDDMLRMAEYIVKSGKVQNKFWTIRTYKPVVGCSWKPMLPGTTLEYARLVKESYPDLKIGIRAKWEPGGFIYL